MARVIAFCQKQVYAPGDNYSDMFEITDCGTLQLEMRVFLMNASAVTGVLQHTSDSSFMENSWQTAASLIVTGAIVTGTSVSGLHRYGRVKLTVSGTGNVTACVNAVGREA